MSTGREPLENTLLPASVSRLSSSPQPRESRVAAALANTVLKESLMVAAYSSRYTRPTMDTEWPPGEGTHWNGSCMAELLRLASRKVCVKVLRMRHADCWPERPPLPEVATTWMLLAGGGGKGLGGGGGGEGGGGAETVMSELKSEKWCGTNELAPQKS